MRLFITSLLFLIGTAQAAPDITIQSLTVKIANDSKTTEPSGDILMPFVFTNDKALGANINDRLYIGQFNALSPRQMGKYLGASDGLSLQGIASQHFSITRKDSRLLTVAFAIDGCGAYCEEYQVSYSFDLTTGRMLIPDELFTADGMQALSKQMNKEKHTRYLQQLSALEKQSQQLKKQKDASAEDRDDLEGRLALNRTCAEQAAGSDADVSSAFSYYIWEFTQDHANMKAERCSNHAMRALDDVGDIVRALPYASLKPYLSTYGKSVFLGEGTKRATGVYGQVLRGHLGNNAIIMLLNRLPDDSISGVYFYEKYRKPIDLSGSMSGNEITLQEYVENSSTQATMRLTITGQQVKGIWNGKQQFDVRLLTP
ncbi:hypothetical protein [Herminiimonas arsenitoxidans]|uniref:hypothetical protein n=1 Tax=Herminiimonas arsenitoxidans TaxID=1809410 RepID=UPI0009712199|nr:hypothetical protein [Herminiimonas arsenitoxidans]